MKSDKQFLKGLWETIESIEYEELQKERARKVNLENSLKSGLIYGCFILGFVLLLCSGFLNMLVTMLIGVFSLVLGYSIESFLLRPKRKKGRDYENRNYY